SFVGLGPPSGDSDEPSLHYEAPGKRPVALCAVLTTEKLSYQAAFEKHVGFYPHQADIARMRHACLERGLNPPESLDPHDRDQWLNFLLSTCVEPHLGEDRPTILYDYPASQGALAPVRRGDPPVRNDLNFTIVA